MRCKAPQGIYVVLNSTEIDTLRVHVKQFPELTIVNILFNALNSRVVLEHMSNHQHKFVSLGHDIVHIRYFDADKSGDGKDV